MASVYEMLSFDQVVSFCMACIKLAITLFFQINTLYAGLLINIFYVHDLLTFYKYAFLIIFMLDCILVIDFLYAYKPKYKDTMSLLEELPISTLGIIVSPG